MSVIIDMKQAAGSVEDFENSEVRTRLTSNLIVSGTANRMKVCPAILIYAELMESQTAFSAT
jgi:hypothetical protein